jgi:hypothetical protein
MNYIKQNYWKFTRNKFSNLKGKELPEKKTQNFTISFYMKKMYVKISDRIKKIQDYLFIQKVTKYT